jgi:hypothetical protein
MEKGESPMHLLERLMTLAADIESYDCDKTQDGFNLTKQFLVDKLLNALAPYHHQMVWDIRHHYGFKEMSPDDIISTFQLFEESKANATKHLAMHGTSRPKTNLALKAKYVSEEEQSEEEDDDDEEGDEIDSDESPLLLVSCVGISPEEERRCSIVEISISLSENQGYRTSRRITQSLVNSTCTQKSKYLRPMRARGSSIPLNSLLARIKSCSGR